MAVATIYIDGEILPDNYIWPDEIATSLMRVRKQVQAAGEFDSIKLMVFSPGGYCVEGWAIYDYLLSLGKPIETVAYGQCASIATVLFLLGEKRGISPNCEFMCHLPWGGAWGNRHEIQDYLDQLIAESDKLIAYYSERTGQPSDLLAANMVKDWYMTPQETVTNSFATEIFQPGTGILARAGNRATRKPVFLLNLKDKKEYKPVQQPVANSTKQKKSMANVKTGLTSLFSGILAVLNGEEFRNLDVTTTDGTTLSIESTGDSIAVGDTVMINGATAPDGDYTLSDGRTITVAGGLITAITDLSAAEETQPEETQASAEQGEETITISKAEYDDLKAKITAMDTKYAKLQDKVTKVLGAMESQDVNTTAQRGETVDTTVKNKGQVQDDVTAGAIERKQQRLAKAGKPA